ncbi:MAG: SigE family RNA polymerase sigma factor [Dermatophilaceae bacterium]
MHAAVVPRASGIDVAALYAGHWRTMVRLAVLLVDDLPTAEDVVQEAFVSLYRRRDAVRAPEAALAYVRAAVVNGARSSLRHRGVVRRKLPLVVAGTVEERDEMAAVDGDDAMIQALATLPPRMREVLVLRYWLDLTEAQTADALGISPGSVKSAASRGIGRLRERIGGGS